MKNIVFIICLLCVSLSTKAQYTREDAPVPTPNGQQPAPPTTERGTKEPSKFWSNVSIGGGFELQLGQLTLIGLSPLFNYHLLDNVEIGIGPMYQYISIDEGPPYGTSTSVTYGGRICANVFLPGNFSNLFLHGEYDVQNVPDYSYFTNVTRATLEFPMAGLGYKRDFSDKSFYYLELSYNFNNSALSPYFTNPVIEAGFDFGL